MMRRLTSGALIAVIFALATSIGTDSVSAECRTDPLSGETTCRLTRPRLPDREQRLGDPRSSPFVWIRYFWASAASGQLDGFCERTTVVGATTTTEYGNAYIVALRNVATDANVTQPRGVCDLGQDPALEPPPPPPTEAEFVEAARALVTVETSLSPRVEIGGLTGLDTWLWCDDPGEVQVGVLLRGWSATATMDAVEYAWEIDGTASASFVAGSCGSEASPAASWMPETMGPYSVTLTATWAGTWTLAYNGFPAGTFPLGPFDFSASSLPYPVDEYRGVLRWPGEEES